MSLVEKVKTICIEQMAEIADTIEGELKDACPVRSGEARRAIHTTQLTDTSYRIGGRNLHLYYADQGNDKSGGRIYPKGKALAFEGWGPYAGKGKNKDGKYVLPSVSAYEGHGFVKEVADRHR